jgi:phage terminase small subunit
MNALARPQAHLLKKYLSDLIGPSWANHEEIIERIAPQLAVGKDLEAFGALLLDVYKAAYDQCVHEHREQLKKAGMNVQVNTRMVGEQPAKQIFKNQ